MTDPDSPTAPAEPTGGAPWGPDNPLTAYCCVERAAAAIDAAEHALRADNATEHQGHLQGAAEWRQLAQALATNSAMGRPRDPDRDERRR